jgi:5'-nucleotidase
MALALLFTLQCGQAWARNIVLTNDDGLTSNLYALYTTLKSAGHDVIVSTPCSNQSGMGAALIVTRPLGPLVTDCRNDAARAGAPGVGAMTRAGLSEDFYYVDGTPVMALLYGLDVLAQQRWGRAPDLVLSGPNEGQNLGYYVLSSGTIGNVQYAAARGIPAIALSASSDTADDIALNNPRSLTVARLTLDLIMALEQRADTGPLLPASTALNVNFPDALEGAKWRLSRIGAYTMADLRFTEDVAASASADLAALARQRGIELPHLPGLSVVMNDEPPLPEQQSDESAVYRHSISISVMQVAYDHTPSRRRWLQRRLNGFIE